MALSTSHSISSQLVQVFRDQFGRKPTHLVQAPGRIVLLGAHVDYNEGWVLSGAIDRSVWVAAAATANANVTILSKSFGQHASFSLDDLQVPSAVSWLRYPMGVAWSLQELGYSPCGLEAVIASELPMGAGVSSSAAVEVAMVMTWEVLSGFLLTPRARARIGQKTENEFLGVGSGIMDQFICVQGQKDHLILLDCRSLDYEIIPVSEDVAIILADSGARRALTEIGYNDRPRECQVAVRLLQSHMPDIRTLRDVSPEEFERHAHRLPLSLRRRARHVISECTRVLDGAEALRQRNLVAFGELMQKSQASSRDNYENSIAEFDFLASMASQLDGCYGARFAGGGFGGMMQILADRSAVGRLQQTLQRAFKAEFKRELPTLRCTLAAGAQHFRL